MHVPSGLGEQRRNVATRALGLTFKNLLASFGSLLVNAALGQGRSNKPKLIEMERSEFRRHQVGIVPYVCETVLRRDRELLHVVQSRIEKVSLAMHLKNRDERVPLCNRAPSRPRMQIHTGQSKRRRNQDCGSFSVWTKCFAVQEQLCIEMSSAPAVEHLSHRRLISPQQFRRQGQVGRERYDRTDIQVAIRPAIQPLPDAGRQ